MMIGFLCCIYADQHCRIYVSECFSYVLAGFAVQAYLSAFGECSSSMVSDSMRHSMYSATYNHQTYGTSERNLEGFDQFGSWSAQNRITSLRCSPSFDYGPDVTLGLTKSTSEDSRLNPPPLIPPKQRDQV